MSLAEKLTDPRWQCLASTALPIVLVIVVVLLTQAMV